MLHSFCNLFKSKIGILQILVSVLKMKWLNTFALGARSERLLLVDGRTGRSHARGCTCCYQCNNIRASLHSYEINITFRIVVKFLLVREAADTSRFLKECSRLFRVPKSLKSGDTVNMYCFPF